MPITLKHPIELLSEKGFHDLDYEIMRLSFEIHNELGRFYDESIYQEELEKQCRTSGIRIEKEFKIQLIHNDFVKPLYIDLLINGSTVYELKACTAIAEPNRIQTLNYLFATNTRSGKLINFRPASVEHEFVSTNLNLEKRRTFNIVDTNWGSGKHADQLREIVIGLLSDWGTFFDTDIYLDAIYHFLGGKEVVLQNLPIINNGTTLGHQRTPLLSKTEAFLLTSVTKNSSTYQNHLLRFLNHTHLEYLHWINLNHQTVSFTSLKRKSFCP